jgi:hypothetical protein
MVLVEGEDDAGLERLWREFVLAYLELRPSYSFLTHGSAVACARYFCSRDAVRKSAGLRYVASAMRGRAMGKVQL